VSEGVLLDEKMNKGGQEWGMDLHAKVEDDDAVGVIGMEEDVFGSVK